MAQREGFEPPDSCPSTVFKTAAFDHSAISAQCFNILAERTAVVNLFFLCGSLFLPVCPRVPLKTVVNFSDVRYNEQKNGGGAQ